jgi:hypothetical protein
MIFTRNRLREPSFERRPNLRNLCPGNYRFGRRGAQAPARTIIRSALSAAWMFLAYMQRFVAAARRHRIEREFRIHGPRHDWLRIDDDHVTPTEH